MWDLLSIKWWMGWWWWLWWWWWWWAALWWWFWSALCASSCNWATLLVRAERANWCWHHFIEDYIAISGKYLLKAPISIFLENRIVLILKRRWRADNLWAAWRILNLIGWRFLVCLFSSSHCSHSQEEIDSWKSWRSPNWSSPDFLRVSWRGSSTTLHPSGWTSILSAIPSIAANLKI